MKAFLMHRDRDFDLKAAAPANEAALRKDLELDTLFVAMANGDPLILDVVSKAVLTGAANDLATIAYRQDALRDCLNDPQTVRRLYGLAEEAFQRQKKVWRWLRDYPSSTLDSAVSMMAIFVDVLKRVRALTDQNAARFKSDAFSTLFATLARELSDDYFAVVDAHLKRLRFRDGVLISAALGTGLKGTRYILRRPVKRRGDWFARLFKRRSRYTLYLAPRDDAGARAMAELRDRGLALAADALSKSADHVLNFLHMLQTELAFYIGCLNLHDRLLALGAPVAFPTATASGLPRFSCEELYDVCLALSMNRRPVGNDVVADGKILIVATGANQGGKTTFLRSVGLAQLAMQCGMFVAAERFQANLVGGVFTHFRREEDATMRSGKFDEELSRMNDIVEVLAPRSLVLFNESFAATNEREGSEIARQIVSALLERAHKIVFVSHQFAFAHGFFERGSALALFLRADRLEDGRRTFKLIEGEPLETSFGEDVYREVFARTEDAKTPPTLARSASA